MNFLEKNLEDLIYTSLKSRRTRHRIMRRGLHDAKGTYIAKRQLKIGNYGIADLVTFERGKYSKDGDYFEENPSIVKIWELKKGEINIDTLIQASKYLRGVKNWIYKKRSWKRYEFKIVLIGSKVNINDWTFLIREVVKPDMIVIYKYKYTIDGIQFKRVELGRFDLSNKGI